MSVRCVPRRNYLLLFLAGLATWPGLAGGQDEPPDLTPPHLFAGTGRYERVIATKYADAQTWFNQGLNFLYAFNHDEAIRSFRQVVALDPHCAMGWWGLAYAHGFHINKPKMDAEQVRQAYESAQEALLHVDSATAAERALIQAVAKRYAWPAPEDRSALDQDYARAMQRAFEEFPVDADIGALYAESLMDMQPWDLWTPDGKPKGRTDEIVRVLESVLTMSPNHPGANHFYIHAVEASPWPAKATAVADRLRSLAPGLGHLVHMPSHVYIRTGRYAEAAAANEAAIAADRAYFQQAAKADFYNLYFLHNLHFLAYSSMMEGRFAPALAAARDAQKSVPADFLRDHVKQADGLSPVVYHVLIRFGKWNDILAENEPDEHRLISRLIHHYARAVALANLRRSGEAQAELDAFDELAGQIDDEWFVGNNPAAQVLPIARGMALGELAFHDGRREEAFEHLRAAVQQEDLLAYDEPPGWMQPVRHALGALLVADGRYDEAIDVYQVDLEKHPENGWSLLGLRQALALSGRETEAEAIAERLARAWPRADVTPEASCYCQPRS